MSSFPEFLSSRISCSADTKQGSTLGCWYRNLKKGLFYVVNTDSTSLTKGKDKGRAGDVLTWTYPASWGLVCSEGMKTTSHTRLKRGREGSLGSRGTRNRNQGRGQPWGRSPWDFGSWVLTVGLWPVSLKLAPFDGRAHVFSSDLQATVWWGRGSGYLVPSSCGQRGSGLPCHQRTAPVRVPEGPWNHWVSGVIFFPLVVCVSQLSMFILTFKDFNWLS